MPTVSSLSLALYTSGMFNIPFHYTENMGDYSDTYEIANVCFRSNSCTLNGKPTTEDNKNGNILIELKCAFEELHETILPRMRG